MKLAFLPWTGRGRAGGGGWSQAENRSTTHIPTVAASALLGCAVENVGPIVRIKGHPRLWIGSISASPEAVEQVNLPIGARARQAVNGSVTSTAVIRRALEISNRIHGYASVGVRPVR